MGSSSDSWWHEAALKRAMVLGVMMVLAMVVGFMIGVSNLFWIYIGAGLLVVMLVVIELQHRAWVLILLGWTLGGQISVLPLPFSVREVMTLLALAAYIGHRFSSTAVRTRPHFLDVVIWLNLGWFAVTFVVHPAGSSALGHGTSGLRVYVQLGFAALAYWLIVHTVSSVNSVRKMPYYLLASVLFTTVIQILGYVFPYILPYVYRFYNDFDWDVYFSNTTRLKGLSQLGLMLIPVLCAFNPPRKLFHPLRLRFYIFALGLLAILLSGFRNCLLWTMTTVAIAALCYRGWRELVLAGGVGIVLLTGLVVGHNRYFQLPQGVQRTLSFLPGNWDAEVLLETAESTRWRVELWKTVLQEDTIKNWWVGDGFAISMGELATLRGGTQWTDTTLVTGYYHSGPLTSIRFGGVVGLILIYIFMIVVAIAAGKAAVATRGTEIFPMAVYLATQLIWYPFHFTLVFGTYHGALFDLVSLTALLLVVIRLTPQAQAEAQAAAALPVTTK